MGEQRDADYYDGMYRESDHYGRAAKEAAWYPLWKAVAEYIPENSRVFDIGCGPGQFYEVVYDRARDYLGVDFSPVAVQRARSRAPGARFVCVNLNDLNFNDYVAFDTFVFCEVLEHIEPDVEILSRVPVGKRVILTVPNFDDPSHVRHFSTLAEVSERYQGILDLRVSKKIDNWFLLVGFTKGPPKR